MMDLAGIRHTGQEGSVKINLSCVTWVFSLQWISEVQSQKNHHFHEKARYWHGLKKIGSVVLLRSSGTFYSLTNWTTKPQVPTRDTPSKSKSLFWTFFVTSDTLKKDHVEDFEGWVTWVFSRALPTTRVCWPWSSDGPVVHGDRSCQVISDKLIVYCITMLSKKRAHLENDNEVLKPVWVCLVWKR